MSELYTRKTAERACGHAYVSDQVSMISLWFGL
jgi:hypothetical protein